LAGSEGWVQPLSSTVPDVWRKKFADAGGTRSGTGAYVNGPNPVARGQWVEWSIPISDMEDAVRHVEQRILETNTVMAKYIDEIQRAKLEAIAAETSTYRAVWTIHNGHWR
jgi:hypothetical protein